MLKKQFWASLIWFLCDFEVLDFLMFLRFLIFGNFEFLEILNLEILPPRLAATASNQSNRINRVNQSIAHATAERSPPQGAEATAKVLTARRAAC